MRMKPLVLCALVWGGCTTSPPADEDTHTDEETDTDVDTEVDTDTDAHTDVDTDTDGIPNACVWTASSTLPGVSLTGGEVACTWTLEQADAGVEVPWTLVVSEVHDVRVDMVSCAAVDDSGLRFSEWVSASPTRDSVETWCPRCDIGLCVQDPNTYSTVPGTYASAFTWRPRRWDGPSDYGAQPLELFPAGAYTLVVRAGGTLGSDGTPWEVRLTAPVTLLP